MRLEGASTRRREGIISQKGYQLRARLGELTTRLATGIHATPVRPATECVNSASRSATRLGRLN